MMLLWQALLVLSLRPTFGARPQREEEEQDVSSERIDLSEVDKVFSFSPSETSRRNLLIACRNRMASDFQDWYFSLDKDLLEEAYTPYTIDANDNWANRKFKNSYNENLVLDRIDNDTTPLLQSVIAHTELEERVAATKQPDSGGFSLGQTKSELEQELAKMVETINKWGFSIYHTDKVCNLEIDKFVDMVKSGAQKKCNNDPEGSLDTLVQEGYMLDLKKNMHDCISITYKKGVFKNSKAVRRDWDDITNKKQVFKRNPLVLGNAYAAKLDCYKFAKIHGGASLHFVAERLDKETTEPVKWLRVLGIPTFKCREETSKGYCPEGMSPMAKRKPTPALGTASALAAFFAAGPASIAAGGFIGGHVAALLGGAATVGASTGMMIGAATPLGVPLALAAYSMTGKLSFPTCSCFENACRLDSLTQACQMVVADESSNPYQALPYPGQKCVRTGEICGVRLCEQNDLSANFSGRLDGHEITGRIGKKYGSVFNCLKVDSTPLEELMEIGSYGENSPMTRSKMYEHLGVVMDVPVLNDRVDSLEAEVARLRAEVTELQGKTTLEHTDEVVVQEK
eukprot:TRINITY_DN76482_c0_g1_i1.p1 TRINITY_DN76482_c0_g1~~TRINITY_DN76482_c0_g1_i1.p1  ORF type:complete len:570 (+),score=98.69 TRINITY_DN76482_c0_g1_i1:24-1733(+)